MIIKERDITDSNGSYILKYTDQLYEHEMTYPASIIPVIYSKKTNCDLIQLESFLQFGKYNNISDGTLAVSKICEANNISMKNIGFIVNEENLYNDSEVANTYIQLCEYNFPIFVKPISKHSIYYMKLNEALILDRNYANIEESDNIIKYCMYPIGESLEDTRKTISKKLASVKQSLKEKINEFRNTTGADAKLMINNQINKLKSSAEFLKNKLSELKS